MKKLVLLSVLLCSMGLAADGDTDETKQDDIADPRVALWRLELGETTKIVLSVQSITSVAMHPFMLNGENKVTELTVDTTGNNTIRFYYIHPADNLQNTSLADHKQVASAAKQRLTREATRQKNDSALPSVKFPEGTYAHSIEYQVDSLEALQKIYKSLISVWEKGSKKMINLNIIK